MDYLRYYLSPASMMLGVLGLWLGGAYVWLGLITLPILALGDTLTSRDFRSRKVTSSALAYVPVMISCVLAVLTYCLLARVVGSGALSTFNIVGAVISTGWIATIIGVPAFHELFHRRNRILRNIGLTLQVLYFDPTRDIAHVVGHHIDVGTGQDSDTARRGQSLYVFGVQAMWHSFVTSLKKESDALERSGKGRFSLGHRVWKALVAVIAFEGAMFLIGGLAGMLACIIAGLLARFLLESFNYFQHYGQVRIVGSPIEKRHVWNHFGRFSRAMTFEITNHAGHHLNGFTPYYELEPDKEAVQLPSVFVCFMSALVPPIWYRTIIMPALRKWDNEHASPAERQLARQQNREAGWPDWFDTEREAAN